MKQLEYQGHAQRTGFDPIKAPDQTARILAEGQRTIRGMEAVRNQERQNRDAYLSGLQRKHQLEEQNRDSNYNLEKGFREKYQAAVLQNYKTRVNDANQRAGDIEKITGSLSAFSETLAKKYNEYTEAKGEAEELAGYNAVFEMGITLDEYNQLKTLESQVDAFDQANNGLIASLRERGVGAEQINQFRQLSGRRQVGAMKAFAIQGADNYPIFRAENQDRMFTINGEEHSLNTAQNAGPAVWAAVNAQLRTEYLKQYRGLDPKFLNEYLFKGMREVENQEKVAFANQRSKALSAEFKEEQTNELVTDFKAGGAQGIMDWITRTSGGTSVGLRTQRLAAISTLVDMAKSGQFTASDLEELKAHGVTLNGAKAPKAFGELYSRDLVELSTAIESFNRKEYEQDKFELEQQKDQAEKDLHDFVTKNGPLSEEEKTQYEEWWRQTFKEHPPSGITKFTTTEELADKEADRILEAKARVGQLTTLELMTGRYSTNLINKYRSFATQGDSASKEFVTSTKKAVDQSLKQSLAGLATSPEALSGQFYMMQALAHQDLESRASKLMTKGASPEEAYQEAYQEIDKEIKAGVDGKTGRYALKTDSKGIPLSGEEAGFRQLSGDSGQQQSIRRISQMRNRVAQDNMVIKKTNILTHDEVVAVKNVGKGGSIPGFVYALNQMYPNMTPFELMDVLMESAGQKPITRPPSAAAYDMVRPQFRGLMTFRPSLARTTQAFALSGGPGAPYKQILDLIASKESSNDTVNGGYDSLNTGGSNDGMTAHGSGTGLGKFGRSLTEMTVGEVMDLQARGVLHATGRYQIIQTTLAGLVKNGKASRSDLYDQATQDRLAIALLHGRAGKFFKGEVGAGEVITGMGNEWRGLRNVNPKHITAALQTAKANLNNPNFDVSRMKSSIVYKVGGIGPNGPGQYGPHLDIKQDTGKFFSRTSLDNYIGFDTGAGVVPVSAGVTVAGGQFGAPRSYGSHNGWDYAMPQGTKVILRNGAWVAGKVKTDYGDRITVALPDGRRFNIIHGTAV
jgi:hypothetical protein